MNDRVRSLPRHTVAQQCACRSCVIDCTISSARGESGLALGQLRSQSPALSVSHQFQWRPRNGSSMHVKSSQVAVGKITGGRRRISEETRWLLRCALQQLGERYANRYRLPAPAATAAPAPAPPAAGNPETNCHLATSILEQVSSACCRTSSSACASIAITTGRTFSEARILQGSAR